MNLPRQFRIVTLLMLVAVAAVGFTAHKYFSASARYQRNGDVETLRYLLSSQIRPGDSIGQVASILGPGRRDDGSELGYLLKWRDGPRYDPSIFGPDGIQEGDLLVSYTASPNGTYWLQFRGGVLVNFDPKHFVGPDDTILGLSK